MAELPTGTVTFLFTDLEGSTRLWEEDREAMAAAVVRHDCLLEESIGRHGGVVFSRMGDGMAAAFGTAPSAIAAAVDALMLAVDDGCGFVERAPGVHGWAASSLVGSFLVVDVDEAVELGLEFVEVLGAVLAAEVGLEGAVVALDLALGLGVVGLAVFEGDAERGEFDLEAGGSAAVRGGVDGAVVAEHALGEAVGGGCIEEDAYDVCRGCDGDGDGGEHGAAVVVDVVDDLAVGAVVEVPVGRVGLPALVRELCLEALPACAWAFLGLRGDEPSPDQDPVDRRASGRC